MKIRKTFKFEGAHIVRDCSTDRCMKSIHGHSYLVEVWLEASSLDKGGMVLDFGLMKPYISDFIDSFDHSIALWSGDDPEYLEACKKFSARWVLLPVNPSAENLALIIHLGCLCILGSMKMKNGESSDIHVSSVGVHETKTGYAESSLVDVEKLPADFLHEVRFSEAVVSDWKSPSFWYNTVILKTLP